MQRNLQCGRFDLPLAGNGFPPLVMGILNVTPDSFSDGGRFNLLEAALSHAEQMMDDGVDIIDIGAESTRPGMTALPVEEELKRLLPVLYALRDCGKPLSVDTRNPLVMREALMAGADMINDINGFRTPEAVDAIAGTECGLCIMHMQNSPETMQVNPHYEDVSGEVTGFLQQAVNRLIAAGVERARICVDPGFGFGKNLAHNLQLMKDLGWMKDRLGLPMLVGLSRKAMIGQITGRPVGDRLAGSIAAALEAADRGADIIRVHDVAATIDALKVRRALS
jgi:dihydropteroate synthase